MANILQVKTRNTFIERVEIEDSKMVIAKFRESYTHLDVSIFEPYIHANDIFQDQSKHEFLAELKRTFTFIRRKVGADFEVVESTDTCRGCFIGHQVQIFTTYDTRGAIIEQNGFVIQELGGILLNISRCLYNKDLPPGVDAKIWESRIGIGYTKSSPR